MKRVLLNIIFNVLIISSIFSYETIKLNNMEDVSQVYKEIINAIYHRLNINVEFIDTPMERALNLSNSGITDGEMVRAGNVLTLNENLLKVPTSFVSMKLYVYKSDKNIEINSIGDLSNYSIGILRGVKFIENITNGMNVKVANTLPSLFKILSNNRVDIVLNADMISETGIMEFGINNIIRIEPPLKKIKLYHMLHKKHEYLIPELDRVINEMIEDGSIQKIKDTFKD